MTKEELKNALINHGVEAPAASARKDEFIALYEEHIAPISQHEFSDDDDEVQISPRKKSASKSSRKSASSKKASRSSLVNQNTEELDIDGLEDDKLFLLLRQHGIDAGPIVSSTRDVYKKKLSMILQNGDTAEDPPINGVAVEFSDTEPESADNSMETVEVTLPEPADDTDPEESKSSEDDQPAGVSSPVEIRKSPRSSKSSLSPKVSGSPGRAGLRNRINVDQTDSALLRTTPTPRRSIHSYKVTEKTTQLITRSKDGVETRDSTHTIEKSENTGVEGEEAASKVWPWLKAFFRTLFNLILLTLFLVLFYYIYVNHIKTTGVVEKVQDAIQEAANKAAETVYSEPEKREVVPEQPSVADV